jgi:hypothetical protein
MNIVSSAFGVWVCGIHKRGGQSHKSCTLRLVFDTARLDVNQVLDLISRESEMADEIQLVNKKYSY